MSITSMVTCTVVFFGIDLRGNFLLFWLVHLITTFNGLGDAAITVVNMVQRTGLPGDVAFDGNFQLSSQLWHI